MTNRIYTMAQPNNGQLRLPTIDILQIILTFSRLRDGTSYLISYHKVNETISNFQYLSLGNDVVFFLLKKMNGIRKFMFFCLDLHIELQKNIKIPPAVGSLLIHHQQKRIHFFFKFFFFSSLKNGPSAAM